MTIFYIVWRCRSNKCISNFLVHISELTLFPNTPLSADVRAGLFEEATRLQKHINELTERISRTPMQ